MCSYLYQASSGVYYFRINIPPHLRSYMGGRKEIKRSLGIRHRDEAKALVPGWKDAAVALFCQLERDRDAGAKPGPLKTRKITKDANQ